MDIDVENSSIEVLLAQYQLALAVIKDPKLGEDAKEEAYNAIDSAFIETIEERLDDMKDNADVAYFEAFGRYTRLARETLEYNTAIRRHKELETENTDVMFG